MRFRRGGEVFYVMAGVVRWMQLLVLVEPHHPKAEPNGGLALIPMGTMLQVFFLE